MHVGSDLEANLEKRFERKIEATNAAKRIEAKRQRNAVMPIQTMDKINIKLDMAKR